MRHIILCELTHIGHWLFTTSIQGSMECTKIVLYIHNMRKSADKSLRNLEGETGRTLPEQRRKVTPEAGEIVVEVIIRNRKRQIALHTDCLKPWEPVVNGGVVVIKGKYIGTLGVAKEKIDGGQWVVTFTADDESRDFVFTQSDLAATEPLD
jgi:hypothetical protein